MLNMHLSAAFEAWRDQAKQTKLRGDNIVARVLRHWTHRTSAAALEAQGAAFVPAALPKSTQKQNVSMEGLKMKSEETSSFSETYVMML